MSMKSRFDRDSLVEFIAVFLILLALLGSASRAFAASCDVDLVDPEDAAELVVAVGSMNQTLRATLQVAEKALSVGTVFAPPTEGVTDGYFWCLKERLDEGRAWLASFNVEELAPSSGMSVADAKGKECSELEKVTRSWSGDYTRIIEKNRKAIAKLKQYESKLGSFSNITTRLASVAEELFSQGLWPLGYDALNLEELGREAILVGNAAAAKRRALENNIEAYDTKKANLEAWQAEFRRCSEKREAERAESSAEAGTGADPRLVEFAMADAERSRRRAAVSQDSPGSGNGGPNCSYNRERFQMYVNACAGYDGCANRGQMEALVEQSCR